jgi:hypothetical protein
MSDEVAKAIRENFSSPNVSDSNFEAANIVDVIANGSTAIARALNRLGNADASTPMGGLEAHGAAILEAADKIAGAIHDLAAAIRESKET